MTIDAIALVVCTMMGLALGVDYSLLIVSRFREELADGRSPHEAAMRSRATAGRTTLYAGATLLAALALSAYVQPGSLLLSLATTVGVATVLSVLVAVGALPGLLTLLGPRVNAGAIGGSRRLALAGGGDGGRRAAPSRARRGPDRGPAAAPRRAGDRPHHRRPRHRRAAGLERSEGQRGSDRRRRRPGLGSALRPPRRRTRRPDHDPGTGSPSSVAGSAGSPRSPAFGR